MPPRKVSFQALIHPHPKGQITFHSLWVHTWETFQPSQSNHCSHCNRSSNGYRRHTLCSLSIHCSSFCYPSANGCSHCHLYHATPTGIVIPHLILAIYPTDVTHATIPWSIASLTPATLTTLQGTTSNEEGQATPKTFNLP